MGTQRLEPARCLAACHTPCTCEKTISQL